jgi:hypothetical protein
MPRKIQATALEKVERVAVKWCMMKLDKVADKWLDGIAKP